MSDTGTSVAHLDDSGDNASVSTMFSLVSELSVIMLQPFGDKIGNV